MTKWNRSSKGSTASKCGRWTISYNPAANVGQGYELFDGRDRLLTTHVTLAAAKTAAEIQVERERLQALTDVERKLAESERAVAANRARAAAEAFDCQRQRLIDRLAVAIGARVPDDPGAGRWWQDDVCQITDAGQLRQLAASLRQLADACDAEAAAQVVPEGAASCRTERDLAIGRARCTTTDGDVDMQAQAQQPAPATTIQPLQYLAIQCDTDGRPCGWGLSADRDRATQMAADQWVRRCANERRGLLQVYACDAAGNFQLQQETGKATSLSVSQLVQLWAPVEQRWRAMQADYDQLDTLEGQAQVDAANNVDTEIEALRLDLAQLQTTARATLDQHAAAAVRVPADLDQIGDIWQRVSNWRVDLEELQTQLHTHYNL